MGGLALNILKTLFFGGAIRTGLTMLGLGIAADKLTSGKSTQVVKDNVVAPVFNKVTEQGAKAVDYATHQGAETVKNYAEQAIEKLVSEAKDHPLIAGAAGLGALAWFTGNLKSLVIAGVAAAAIYLGYQHFAKNSFNEAAAPAGNAPQVAQKLQNGFTPLQPAYEPH